MKKEKQFETVGTMSVKEIRKTMLKEGYSQEYFDKIDKISEEIKIIEEEYNTYIRESLRAGKKVEDLRASGSRGEELSNKISELKMEREKIDIDEKLKVAKYKEK